MNKYIIRNCPAIYGIDDGFLCSYREDNESEKYCYDCTDCVMKRIVQVCKEVENIENVETLYDAAQSGIFLQANRILKLLDIEEVE